MVTRTKIFNIQALKVLDYNTKRLIGDFRTVASFAVSISAELAAQMNGPSLLDIETEVNRLGSEATLQFGEYNADLINVVMGSRSVVNSISNGLIKNITNRSVVGLHGTGGSAIESIGLTAGVNIKSGRYRLELADKSNNMYSLIALSSPDLKHGDYADRDKSIVETKAIGDGESVDFSIGVTVVGKASIDLSNNDDQDGLDFQVFAEGAISESIDIGQEDLEIPKVSLIALSRNLSDGRWVEIEAPNCIFPGLNLNMGGEFSQTDITGKLIYDQGEDKLLTLNTFQKGL